MASAEFYPPSLPALLPFPLSSPTTTRYEYDSNEGFRPIRVCASVRVLARVCRNSERIAGLPPPSYGVCATPRRHRDARDIFLQSLSTFMRESFRNNILISRSVARLMAVRGKLNSGSTWRPLRRLHILYRDDAA